MFKLNKYIFFYHEEGETPGTVNPPPSTPPFASKLPFVFRFRQPQGGGGGGGGGRGGGGGLY